MKTRYYIHLIAVIAIWAILMPQTIFSGDKRYVHRVPRDTVLWVNAEKGIWRARFWAWSGWRDCVECGE